MNRVLILFLTLIVCVACGKEDNEIPVIPVEPEVPTIPEVDVFEGYNVKDTVGFDRETVLLFDFDSNTKGISGVKNSKIWFGLYNKTTKDEIQVWNDSKIYDEAIRNITPLPLDIPGGKVLSFDWGYAVSVGINAPKVKSVMDYPTAVLLLRKNEKEMISYDFSPKHKKISSFSDNILVDTYEYNPDFGSIDDGDAEFESSIISSSGERLINSVSFTSIGDSTLYSGFSELDKLWFGLCDQNGRIQKEWNGSEPIERNVKIHLGYGEYEDYYIKTVLIDTKYATTTSECFSIIDTPWGYAIQPAYKPNKSNYSLPYFIDLIFLNNDKVYRVMEDKWVYLYNWNNESVITRTKSSEILYTVYSSIGDIILTKDTYQSAYVDPFMTGVITPVSYDSYIHKSVWSWGDGSSDIRFRRYNLNSQATSPLWSHVIKSIPSTTKVEWTLLKRDAKVWRYQIDLLNYDGSKERIVFSVNIDSGDLNIE
ncbi:hypothetical protein LJB97_05675 [Parabacteroides sp. OttesenSCG-928-O15]|nr:hypothetical protein [Parabacteroides sp. OttesenSCG-928-O15]